MAAPKKSEIAQAIEARERPHRIVDVAWVGQGERKQAALCAPTYREEFLSRLQAADWLQKNAATVDVGKLEHVDLASVWLVYMVTRDAETRAAQVFPSPQWMWQHLSAEELARLVDELNDLAREQWCREFSEREALDMADALAVSSSQMATEMLGSKPRAWLIAFAHWLAKPAGATVGAESFEFIADADDNG